MALINTIGAGIFTTFKYVADTSLTIQPRTEEQHQSALFAGSVNADALTGAVSIDILVTSGALPATGSVTINDIDEAYTAVSVTGNIATLTVVLSADITAGDLVTLVGGSYFASPLEVANVRDFPAFGTPANIVNVPVYGQAVSSQISGQADAPTLELTLNYVPADAVALEALVNDGNIYLFQIDLRNSEMADSNNATFYVKGSFASLLITPNLTDSTQATLSLTTVSDYTGPFADVS